MFAYECITLSVRVGVCLRFSTGRMRARVYEIACVSKRGVFLSISMHLLQIVSIYLFIFPRREKNVSEDACLCDCVFDWLLMYL